MGKIADLSPQTQSVVCFLMLALVPRVEGFADADHIEACTELLDNGYLWFQQKEDSYYFRRCIAGSPVDSPWVDCTPAFA